MNRETTPTAETLETAHVRGRLAEDLQRPQHAELLEIDPALRREMVAHLGELGPEPPA